MSAMWRKIWCLSHCDVVKDRWEGLHMCGRAVGGHARNRHTGSRGVSCFLAVEGWHEMSITYAVVFG